MRKFHRSTILLLAVLMCLNLAVPAHAKDVVDMSQKGSLTVTLKLYKQLTSRGTLTLYRVGDIYYDQYDDPSTTQDDRGYKFAPVPELDDGKLSFLNLEKRGLADEVAKLVQKKKLPAAKTQRITYNRKTEQSEAVFEDLELGLYLVVQENAAAGYYKLSPFLVSVPYYMNDQYLYDVTVEAKSELEKVPEDTPKKDGTLPQTGQLNWPIPTLVGGGALLIVLGWGMRNKKKEENA